MTPSPPGIAQALLDLYPAFPGSPPERLLTCEKIAEGWECDVYAFALAPEAGSEDERSGSARDLVLKIYLGNRATAKCTREFELMGALRQRGVPVPAVLRSGGESSPFAAPYVVMERAAGRLAGDVFAAAAEDERGALIHQFCRLLVDLHALDWRGFASALPFAADSPGAFIDHELSTAEEKTARFAKPEFTPVLSWLRERSRGVPCARLSVLHGDYHEANLLLAADGTPAIIDWSGARIGDRRCDLAWTLLLVATGRQQELRPLLRREYERLAGGELDQLEYFDVLAALRRLLNTSISASHGAESLGMRPGAEAFMQQNRDHLRAVYGLLVERTGIELPVHARP
jgi:aminoglycoside phosphotransferase (APT) family kinase protein